MAYFINQRLAKGVISSFSTICPPMRHSPTATSRKALEFAARIYDAVLNQKLWNQILDDFTDTVGAGGATLQILDHRYAENQCNAMSVLYRNDPHMETKFEYYFGELWKKEEAAYEYAHNHPQEGFIPEYVGLGKTPVQLEQHEPSIWMRDNFGIFFRLACRLNTTNMWMDHLSFQYPADRKEATPQELQFANLFIPHFAKAVELGRTFNVLKARYSAVLAALDHYLIGTFIVLPNGTLVLENTEGRRIMDRRDGVTKDSNGRLNIASRDDGKQFLTLVARVSATANAEGMDSEEAMMVSRRSTLDPYLVTICPLRDPDNTLDSHFRGAIIYVIDPSHTSIISTDGIGKLYNLTPAEEAVCSLIVKGLNTNQIAETRSVKVETVRSQIKDLMGKMHVSSRIQLVKLALNVNLPISRDTGAIE